MKVIIIFVVFLKICSCNRALIDPSGYFKKIFDNISAQLLENPSNILKLVDFEEYFYTQAADKIFNGTVWFHSGFVNRIKKFEIEYNLEEGWNDDEVYIRRTVKFNDFSITYEVDCLSEEYSTPSVLVFAFSNILLYVRISRNHFEKKIVSLVTSRSEGTIIAQNFPDNAYTQIIAREVNPTFGTTPLKTKLIESIRGWANILQTLVEKATEQVEFVELCHYCPGLPF